MNLVRREGFVTALREGILWYSTTQQEHGPEAAERALHVGGARDEEQPGPAPLAGDARRLHRVLAGVAHVDLVFEQPENLGASVLLIPPRPFLEILAGNRAVPQRVD